MSSSPTSSAAPPITGENLAETSPPWLMLLSGLLCAATLIWVIAGFVDLLAPWVPPPADDRIGASFWNELAPQFDPERPARFPLAESLTERLARHMPLSLRPRLGVIVGDEINGFVLPGARLLLTRGALVQLEDPEQLAFLIGHLLAHVYNKDHLEMLDRGLFLAIGADFLGVGRAPLARQLIAGGLLTRQQFRQRQELDADRYAMWLLQREFGRTDGALGFLQTLDARGRPLSHFSDSPTAATARKRALQVILREEGWNRPPKTPTPH